MQSCTDLEKQIVIFEGSRARCEAYLTRLIITNSGGPLAFKMQRTLSAQIELYDTLIKNRFADLKRQHERLGRERASRRIDGLMPRLPY